MKIWRYFLIVLACSSICSIYGQGNLVLQRGDLQLPVHKFIHSNELKSDFLIKKSDKYYFYNARRFFSTSKSIKGSVVFDDAYNTNPYGQIDTSTHSNEVLLLTIGKKECLEISLKDSLRAGQVYNISCYVQLALCSPLKLRSIPFCLSKNSIANYLFPNEGVYFSKSMQDTNKLLPLNYLLASDSSIVGENYWRKVSSVYYAKGGEKFLIIGMPYNTKFEAFKNNTQSLSYLDEYKNKEYFKKRVKYLSSNSVCYFIDSISVSPLKSNNITYQNTFNVHVWQAGNGNKNIKNFPMFELEQNKSYPLTNVYFKDSTVNLKKSLDGLNSFRENIFNKCTNCKVTLIIITHDLSNVEICNKRINSLRNYIVDKMRIPASRIGVEVKVINVNREYKDTEGLYFRIDSF